MTTSRTWWEGTAWLGSGRNGGAVLRVSEGTATIEISGLLRFFSGLNMIEKHRGTVLLSRVRLRLPWMSTVVRLDRRTSFTVGFRAGRSVAQALRDEGFVVNEEKVWLWPARGADLESVTRVPA